jgi:MYXO-CTERM domain-containing protein
MSTPNHEPKPASNMDALKQQAEACGAGCACHTPGPSGRTRWVLGAIILVGAAALAGRAVLKSNTTTATSISTASATTFAAPASPGVAVAAAPAGAPPPAPAVPVAAASTVAPTAPAAGVSPAVSAGAAVPGPKAVVGTEIAAFAELNALAADTTAVFVFVPAKSPDATPAPSAQMEAAARTIAAQGKQKVGIFTLKTDSADYEQILGQVTAPGVLALVKGRGMNAVSGEITETKLVQAFVAASKAGGCGSGSSGCGPATPGCK